VVEGFCYSFLIIDSAAIMMNAIPASVRLLVRNQTMNAIIAAGMSMSASLMRKMSMIMPISTSAAKSMISNML